MVLALILLVVGCQVTSPAEQQNESNAENGQSEFDSESPMATVQPVTVEPELRPTLQPTITVQPIMPDLNDNPLVASAISDLAQRLNESAADITVISATSKTWPDSSMGCPLPGMVYMQVLTDGMFIQLSVNNVTYNYHSGGNRMPFLCEQQLKTDKKPPGQIDLPTPPTSLDE